MGCFSGSLVEQLIHVPKGYCRGPGLAPLQPVPTCYLLTFSLFHLSLVISLIIAWSIDRSYGGSYWGCWLVDGPERWIALAVFSLLVSLKCSRWAGLGWFKCLIRFVIRIVFPPVSLWFTLLNSGSSVTVKSSHDNDMLACGRECVQDLHMNKIDQLAIRHERLTGWSPVQAVHTENQPFPVSGCSIATLLTGNSNNTVIIPLCSGMLSLIKRLISHSEKY